MNILYSHEAKIRIRNIRCNLPPKYSESILNEIREGCRRLSDFPDLGYILEESGAIPVRVLLVKGYAILYEHDDESVYISAIEPMKSDFTENITLKSEKEK